MNQAQSITCEDCGELIDLDNFYMHMHLNFWKCESCGKEDDEWIQVLTDPDAVEED